MHPQNIYPRANDTQTVYLKNVIIRPQITVGNFTIYNDVHHDPRLFEQNNVLYHYPINHDRLIIGKFCSIASGTTFLLNSANHRQRALSTYPFPIFSKNGRSLLKTSPTPGTTKATSSSATTSG